MEDQGPPCRNQRSGVAEARGGEWSDMPIIFVTALDHEAQMNPLRHR